MLDQVTFTKAGKFADRVVRRTIQDYHFSYADEPATVWGRLRGQIEKGLAPMVGRFEIDSVWVVGGLEGTVGVVAFQVMFRHQKEEPPFSLLKVRTHAEKCVGFVADPTANKETKFPKSKEEKKKAPSGGHKTAGIEWWTPQDDAWFADLKIEES